MQHSQAGSMARTSITLVMPAVLHMDQWYGRLASVRRTEMTSHSYIRYQSLCGVDCLLVGLAGCRQMRRGPFSTSHLVL
jgi:hypothetical protein